MISLKISVRMKKMRNKPPTSITNNRGRRINSLFETPILYLAGQIEARISPCFRGPFSLFVGPSARWSSFWWWPLVSFPVHSVLYSHPAHFNRLRIVRRITPSIHSQTPLSHLHSLEPVLTRRKSVPRTEWESTQCTLHCATTAPAPSVSRIPGCLSDVSSAYSPMHLL